MLYELIDTSSGNVVGVYECETAALRDVAETISRFGTDSVLTLALGSDGSPQSPGQLIAAGEDLANRALNLLEREQHGNAIEPRTYSSLRNG